MDTKSDFFTGNIRFERRRFKRINRNYVISYAAISRAELKSNVSQTKNVSEGGLLFTTDKSFQKGTILKVKLRLPDFSDYVIVKVLVVDSVEKARGLMYETRAKFLEIEQKVRDAIRKLADNR